MNLPTAKRFEYFSVNGEQFPMEEFRMDHFIAIEEEYGSEENYRVKFQSMNAKALVQTAHILSDKAREKFPTWKDLAKNLPGSIIYKTLLFYKIGRLYGYPLPDVSSLDMEKATDSDLLLLIQKWNKENPALTSNIESVLTDAQKKILQTSKAA